MESDKPEPSFFEKLRKRRYLEISLVYLGSALAVMEFFHLVIVGMGAPHWSFALVVRRIIRHELKYTYNTNFSGITRITRIKIHL